MTVGIVVRADGVRIHESRCGYLLVLIILAAYSYHYRLSRVADSVHGPFHRHREKWHGELEADLRNCVVLVNCSKL